MAGYICKIVIEDTHPPVWRRVLIPDRITFEELHELIQVLFGWGDVHLHEFQIPSDRITISNEEDTWGHFYNEKETLIDSFFRNYKWIRYIYDFGDDWRHKISIEKTDMDYQLRTAKILKFKGDNFKEDCGGLWEVTQEDYREFHLGKVEEKLKFMEFPIHEELKETKLLKETLKDFKNLFNQLLELTPEVLQSTLAAVADDFNGNLSPMARKIEEWRTFEEEESVNALSIVLPTKFQRELLLDLGEKEAADYYKYLCIPRTGILSLEKQVDAISNTLREHPEYLLYIFDENEYKELTEWLQYVPFEHIRNKPKTNMMMKALGMGLADFTGDKSCRKLSFAADVDYYVRSLNASIRKKTYKILEKFDAGFGKLIQVYGLIELESLYEIYKKLYEADLDKESFCRYIYWHARFNNFINTAYRMDGTCYVVSKEIDMQRNFEKMEKYAKELSYAEYSKQEIEYMGGDLANRSKWMDILFSTLLYQFGMQPLEGQDCLLTMVSAIVNGENIYQVIEILKGQKSAKWTLDAALEVWIAISGLMLELELPALKGRSRIQYAKEQNISPWSIDMVSEQNVVLNTQNYHIYQFPAEVQEWMYEVVNYGSKEQMKLLLDYKEQNHIRSEEYLYLLAYAGITFGYTKEAEQIVSQLKNLSANGKKAAQILERRLEERHKVMDEEDFWEEIYDENWMTQGNILQPYVRNAPKVGRNDKCPCGSGKKYKRCCGK